MEAVDGKQSFVSIIKIKIHGNQLQIWCFSILASNSLVPMVLVGKFWPPKANGKPKKLCLNHCFWPDISIILGTS